MPLPLFFDAFGCLIATVAKTDSTRNETEECQMEVSHLIGFQARIRQWTEYIERRIRVYHLIFIGPDSDIIRYLPHLPVSVQSLG